MSDMFESADIALAVERNERNDMTDFMLTPKAERELEERFSLEREAIELLDLIAAEFASDPTSVQCFDLRIVERAKFVSKRLKQLRVF